MQFFNLIDIIFIIFTTLVSFASLAIAIKLLFVGFINKGEINDLLEEKKTEQNYK